MALQIWLPLNKNGNLKNQGLANVTVTNNGATYNSSGKIGGCYSFDGTDDNLYSVTDKSFWSGKEISFACWFKSDKTKAGGTLIEIGADLTLSYTYNSSGIRFAYWRSYSNNGTRTGDSQTNPVYYNADLWHHVVVTFDHLYNKMYVDGQLSKEWDLSSLYTTNWVPLLALTAYKNIAIGRSYGSTSFIGGLINDVRIYDHCLTPQEVKEISKGLVIHYPLNDGNVTNIAYDCSGYCNNGTITGTLTTNIDTPRYDKCTKYMDSASSIGIGNLSTLVPSGVFTFNIWFKRVTGEWSSKGWETIIGGPSGFELLTKKSSTNSPVIVMYSWNNNAENDIPYELDKWNMLTMVRTSAGTIFYLNGDQKKTGGAGSIPSGNYFIGSWSAATNQNFRGMLSDARIYSTALSADDIKELYNTAAFIDHKGNIGCYLFYEDADSQITKTGQVKTEEFEEISDLTDGVAKVYELKIECNQLIEI